MGVLSMIMEHSAGFVVAERSACGVQGMNEHPDDGNEGEGGDQDEKEAPGNDLPVREC